MTWSAAAAVLIAAAGLAALAIWTDMRMEHAANELEAARLRARLEYYSEQRRLADSGRDPSTAKMPSRPARPEGRTTPQVRGHAKA